MSAQDAALLAGLATAAVHLGFQVTVSGVVYPALAAAPDWTRAHGAHTRAIAPVVAAVYGALLVGGGWALVTHPRDPWVLLAAAGAALSFLTTALVAAPTDGRLGAGRDAALVRRLLVADRWRTAGAAVCVLGALMAALEAHWAP